ncbi:MAG: PRC-barrel domain-containing protein [Armatimonadetes bacterium]|nr:PRC-barrel domain-containing protein [Armatimonadota bacterium]
MGRWPANRLMVLVRMTDLEGKREFRFPDIRGWRVLNTTGHQVGRVEEVFVDPNTLEPGMALLRYQKFLDFNTKQLLVPWQEMRVGDNYVQTRWSERELLPETAAQVPPAEPATAVMNGVDVHMTPHPAPEGYSDEAVGRHELRQAAIARPAWHTGVVELEEE